MTAVGAVLSVLLTAVIDGGGTNNGSPPVADSARPSSEATFKTAAAPTCSGEGCDGLDPKVTGCGDGAVTVAEDWAGTMHVEIRFSPRCGTVWGKLTGAEVGDTVEIRTSPNRRQQAKVLTGHTKYTHMLSVPEKFTAQATALAVNATAARDVPTGHVLTVGADEADLPTSGVG
ncbi:DUF2690 domain-containing protein [Streptomyces sp. HC307]|uniref:DUF2690 domain-containing protein n=1 Tax=Streptomyces flavusporus TaxID=3385496 RepID=UPI0039172C6C